MRVVAVVLAAGEGRRMGGLCKATLVGPDGETALARIDRLARAAGCARVVVVAGPPHGRVVEHALPAGAQLVWNHTPGAAMATSIAFGLDGAADADAALVWPVDHPAAGEDAVRQVVAAASRAGIVIPVVGDRGGHPAAFGADLFPELRAAVAEEGGARAVVHRDPRRVRRLEVGDAGVLLDLDTPEELARWR